MDLPARRLTLRTSRGAAASARLVVVGLALGLLGASLGAAPAAAQIFSPGVLAKPHRKLEGIDNCLKCHEPGNKLSNTRCLDCHKVLARRVKARRGYHGRMAGRECQECHKEHKGLGHDLIVWSPSQSAFDHGKTGWDLKGKHGDLDCKNCHEKRRLKQASAIKLLNKGRRTFLGLDTDCMSCHFDEHRGQLGSNCSGCHTEVGFEKSPGFRHNRDSRFKLTGKHTRVRCAKCHDNKKDTDTPASAFPEPKSSSFAVYKPLAFKRCLDCHEDHHKGAMGNNCTRCHSTQGWDKLKGAVKESTFHDKTDFPLKGAHQGVDCNLCHGPWGKQKEPHYKPIPHKVCADCHMDSHVGQLDVPPGAPGPTCQGCHDEGGFAPSLFDVVRHGEVRYALEGAHRAVACTLCHQPDPKLKNKVPRSVERDLEDKGRSVLLSTFPLKLPDVTGRCEQCHKDVHAEQFDEKVEATGCQVCHQVESFKKVSFDHDTDSRFPLEGKHRGADCRGCHQPDDTLDGEAGPQPPVRYRPIETACVTCHADVHLGQLAPREGAPPASGSPPAAPPAEGSPGAATDCTRCHSTSGFAEVQFDHNDPQLTSFPLRGRHQHVSCESCHPRIEAGPGLSVQWFRGVPQSCAGCHQDQHEGRFDRYVP